MAFHLSWSKEAELDLRDLAAFVCADGSVAGQEFVASLLEKIELLVNFPLMARIVPEASGRHYRELIHHSYRIIYREVTVESEIQIIRIWHAARGTPEL